MSMWWDSQENVGLLISIAEEMCDLYSQQHIVSIGHSPSWLVYAIGKTRQMRGEDSNIRFIPYSGHVWRHVDAVTSDKNIVDVVYDRNTDKPYTEQSLTTYFQNLNKAQRLSLESYQQCDNKTVLVDLAAAGEGFVSFIDLMIKKHGPAFADRFQIHLFKAYYDTSDITIHLENSHDDVKTAPALVQSGAAAKLIDSMGGNRGELNHNYMEKYVGRFMPSYNPHTQDRPQKAELDNGADIASIKKRIHNMLQYARTAEGQEFLQKNKKHMEHYAPKTLGKWNRTYMAHGGGMFGVPSIRERSRQDNQNNTSLTI